jgi:hypothetical protein
VGGGLRTFSIQHKAPVETKPVPLSTYAQEAATMKVRACVDARREMLIFNEDEGIKERDR